MASAGLAKVLDPAGSDPEPYKMLNLLDECKRKEHILSAKAKRTCVVYETIFYASLA